jgi:hypothetical protein
MTGDGFIEESRAVIVWRQDEAGRVSEVHVDQIGEDGALLEKFTGQWKHNGRDPSGFGQGPESHPRNPKRPQKRRCGASAGKAIYEYTP